MCVSVCVCVCVCMFVCSEISGTGRRIDALLSLAERARHVELHKLLFKSMGRVLQERTSFELFAVFPVKPRPSRSNGAILKNAVVFLRKSPTGQGLQRAQTQSVKLSHRQELRWKEGQRLRYSKNLVKAWPVRVIQEKKLLEAFSLFAVAIKRLTSKCHNT